MASKAIILRWIRTSSQPYWKIIRIVDNLSYNFTLRGKNLNKVFKTDSVNSKFTAMILKPYRTVSKGRTYYNYKVAALL